ncbi:L-allo-threonine aldolase [Aureococcus anophagefferens]|nr:L-allo-threonine aldolase [Aureococcus anophagefferens]
MMAARCFSLLLSAATALVAPRQTATRTVARLAAAEPVVDLRSDTVTQPTAAMRAAMGAAVCGDDVFGDDPTVAKLEARVGDLLGKEAAVFVPTGTMGNLVSILAHCWERVVALEDTHNLRGGAALPAGYGAAVAAAVRDLGVAAHLDGARVWHAAARRGEALAETAAPFDSLSVCLSKALGAPAGSTGVLAAAGLVALDEVLPKLSEDAARATALAAGLGALGFDVEAPQTNLLYFGLDEARFGFSARALVDHCADRGVRFLVVPGSTRMRMVCHHQITADGAERALAVIKAACDSGLR